MLALLGITLLVFFQVIFLGRTFFVGDILLQYYPTRFFIQKWLNQDVFPLWASQVFNGFPFLASSQSGIFNPLERIIFAFFPAPLAYNLNVVSHVFLGALGMYALVKLLTKDKGGAFISALSFAFSGYFLVMLSYITIFSICYLPLAFLLAYKTFTRQRPVYLAQLSLILGCQLFAGGAQYTFYTILGLAFLAVFLLCQPALEKRKRYWLPVYFILALLGFLLFAAVQIIPTQELVALSVRRAGVAKEVWLKSSLPLSQLLTVLIPQYWGEMFRFGVYRGAPNYIDLCCYLGITPLLLALLPLFKKNRHLMSNFFYLLTVLALLLALGKYNPLYQYLYYLPVIKTFRYPGRILVLFVFSLAANAGFGYQFLTEKRENPRLRIALYTLTAIWLLLSGIIFWHMRQTNVLTTIRLNGWYKMNLFFFLGLTPLAGWVFSRLDKKWLLSCLAALVLLDNLWFGYPFNPTLPQAIWDYQPQVWRQLPVERDQYRILAQTSLPFFAIARSELTLNNDMGGLVRTNLELLQGSTAFLTPFSISSGYDQLELAAHSFVRQNLKLDKIVGSVQQNPFLTRGSVRYLLRWPQHAIKDLPPDLRSEASLIYELPNAQPRAYLAARHQVIADQPAALKYLNSPQFDPQKEVILNQAPVIGARQEGLVSTNKVTLQEDNPNQVTTEVVASTDCWLVLNDSYYPGWQAFVDGQRTAIYQANLLFRAVPLNKGKHRVVWRYSPASWFYGAISSGLTLLLLVGIILREVLWRRDSL